MRTCTHTHVHTHMRTYAHTHIYTRPHTDVYTLYTNIHVYVHAHAHLYACTRVHVCKFIHMRLSGPGSNPQSVIWKSKPAAGCGSFHAAKFGPWRSVIKADQGRRLAADSRARISQGDSYARTRARIKFCAIMMLLMLLLALMSQLHVARTLHVRCTYVARNVARNVARSKNQGKTYSLHNSKKI